MRIAIDAMGGDHAPDVVVEGVLEAAKTWRDVELILVGDQAKIEPLLTERHDHVVIKHAAEVINGDDEPVRAVRRKKEASMVIAGQMVKEGHADAMISAGNTGALMATSLLVIGRIPGIARPALATMLPTIDGHGVLALDLGANMDADPNQLVQYAVMGSIYRHKAEGIASPRVALLNVGTEDMKGNELTKTTSALLQEAPINFIGNVEARDVLETNCDVLVCDGFVGNIMLKAMEGTGNAIFKIMKEEVSQSSMAKLGALFMRPNLRKIKRRMDYTEYGGALMLGVNGVCIKSHGSSNALAIKNGINMARKALQNNVVETMSLAFDDKIGE